MKTLIELEEFIKEKISMYKKDFRKISKKCIKGESIQSEYIEKNKHTESWPIQSISSQYDFLSELGRYEKDKYIFLYGLSRYLYYINDIENLNIKKEYICCLFFDYEPEFNDLNNNKESLLPYIYYHIWKQSDWKIWRKEWHKWITLNVELEVFSDYINKIIYDLWLQDYIQLLFISMNFWYWLEYSVLLDFKDVDWLYRRKMKDHI